MTDTAADVGFGSKFLIGNGAGPEVFTAVGEVVDITPPKLTVGTTKATHMQSPDQNEEYIPTLGDKGVVSITFNYVPGGPAEQALVNALNAREKKNYQIAWPDTAETWTFGAIMTEFDPGKLTIDGKMEGAASFQPSGSNVTIAD